MTPSCDHIWLFLQVRSLAAQFAPSLQAHLSLAFQDLQVYGQGQTCGPKDATGSLERPTELFQVLLQSQEEAEPGRYLLQEALVQHCPTLAVMAACQQVTTRIPANQIRSSDICHIDV